jgi:hypothetical protein
MRASRVFGVLGGLLLLAGCAVQADPESAERTGSTAQAVGGSTPDGSPCTSNGQCASTYCYPGPDQSYCIAATANCAEPGTSGVQYGAAYVYNGVRYECIVGVGLSAPPYPNGAPCTSGGQCSSTYCYPGPDQSYCIAATANCAEPGTSGVQYGAGYVYNGVRYECIVGVGLSAPPYPNGAPCTSGGQCSSTYCYPGPDQSYCIAATANCAEPNGSGVSYGASYMYNGTQYECIQGVGLSAPPYPNGAPCTSGGQCSSTYCYPGPDQSYCIAATANCAEPSTSGVAYGTSYVYQDVSYECIVGLGLKARPFGNGVPCTSGSDCASTYCYPGPDQSYCIAATANCAEPGTNGVLFGEQYVYQNVTYSCVQGVGLQICGTCGADGGTDGGTDASNTTDGGDAGAAETDGGSDGGGITSGILVSNANVTGAVTVPWNPGPSQGAATLAGVGNLALDSTYVYYAASNGVFKVLKTGGTPIQLTSQAAAGESNIQLFGGYLFFLGGTNGMTVYVVSTSGGSATSLSLGNVVAFTVDANGIWYSSSSGSLGGNALAGNPPAVGTAVAGLSAAGPTPSCSMGSQWITIPTPNLLPAYPLSIYANGTTVYLGYSNGYVTETSEAQPAVAPPPGMMQPPPGTVCWSASVTSYGTPPNSNVLQLFSLSGTLYASQSYNGAGSMFAGSTTLSNPIAAFSMASDGTNIYYADINGYTGGPVGYLAKMPLTGGASTIANALGSPGSVVVDSTSVYFTTNSYQGTSGSFIVKLPK